jgi:Icc-related predicted phosphoesterase
MILGLTSDWHGKLPTIESAQRFDAIIHAGDIGPDYQVPVWIQTFKQWLKDVDRPFYGTFGNHDNPNKWLTGMDIGIYLDQAVEIGGKKFYFSPWCRRFGNWHWMKDDDVLKDVYKDIPEDVQILVSHGPAKGLRDKIDPKWGTDNVGSQSLLDRIMLLSRLEHLVCGHIHYGYGKDTLGSTMIWNVASVDETYTPRQERFMTLEI